MAWLVSAITLGFLGSLHCVGMCGPIAAALPAGKRGRSYRVWSRLTYNAGRLVTYSSMGLLAGALGFTFALTGFQRELSIATGIAIILAVVAGRVFALNTRLTAWINTVATPIKRGFTRYFGMGSIRSSFFIGLLNGLLPCGFVYIALAGAVIAGTGHVLESAAYMALFGMGTIPAMLFVGLTGQAIGSRFNRLVRKASPVIAIAIALLLIYRADSVDHGNCPLHSDLQADETAVTLITDP